MLEFNTPDLFERLQSETRPILLYGMGNGADKILDEMEKRGIPASGVFASDGFARGNLFRGMRVQSYSEIRSQYKSGECVILLAFGSSRPEVLELFEQVDRDFELLVPDMPVCGGALFERASLTTCKDEIEAARALLADEASRQLFDRIIEFRLTGRYSTLMAAVSQKSAWGHLKESGKSIRRIADFGAYNGDSAREAMGLFDLDFILAAEPDRRNFRKLSEWSKTVPDCEIECHQVAICDRVGEAAFDDSGNRNAGLCTGRARVTVQTSTPDALLSGRAVDYMKFDIEGAEREALDGSAQTIRAHLPALRIALYHKSADLFEIPLQLAKISPRYRLYLTRERSAPAWDIDLVAIPT
ncbi:MAG: FkbM family methyltransferase [Clostridia bacterium]|nr:FkbM family methyltransferase [Clostridia bacterium]